jgi:zeta-carotene desaturase
MSGSVIVVGAGIAGIASSVRLAEAGVRVTLVETRKKLGGRATSFVDVRSGQTLDNCQHVVLGCCTTYIDLLRRLGTADNLRWSSEQYWIEAGEGGAGGRTSIIKPGLLPPPLHFAGSLLRAKFLTFREVMAIGSAILRILRTDRSRHEAQTFGDFLRACRQPQRAIRRFWSPVIVSACNLDVDRVSAASALHVFQEGFLSSRTAAAIGVPAVPLVQLYDGVESLLARAGGRVLLGTGVERLSATTATTTDGQTLDADAVICAVPVERVNRIVDEEVRRSDPRFAGLDRFTHSPIVGVHIMFDRPVMPPGMPHCVLVDRGTQWLFRKDAGEGGDGRYIHAVISAADDWVALSEDEIGRRVVEDVRAGLGGAIDHRSSFIAGQDGSRADPASPGLPQVLWVRAVKEKLATWAPLPGIEALRPPSTGPSGLILAGDYTATGWPATMEGAARSGYAAAAAALAPQSMKNPQTAGVESALSPPGR